MKPDKVIRAALWISVPFNAIAAYIAAVPSSWPGQLVGLPEVVPAPYPEILGFFIAAFGVVYAWLALQKTISRPLVGFAACAKIGVFMVAALLWVSGDASGRLALLSIGDFVLAVVFFWWLFRTARYANK
ncbi:MAG: hypothetical protein R3352_10035 [Salinisphaeraceae bacterium]|nr:hypothetical protein [Salinisphaeraceae bacterium]